MAKKKQPRTDVPDPAKNVAAAGAGTARKSAGLSAAEFNNVSGAPSPNTKTVAKKGSGKQGDAGQGTAGNRSQIPAERLGPAFTVSAAMVKQVDPSAGSTQANGRIVPSACVRSTRGSFDSERLADY